MYGLTHRSNPTVREWKGRAPESLRICRPAGEEEHAERWLRAFHLWPVRVVERRGTVEELVPLARDGGYRRNDASNIALSVVSS